MNFKALFSLFALESHSRSTRLSAGLNLLLATLLISALFSLIFHQQAYDFSGVWEYRKLFIQGWLNTLWISAASLVLSSLIGLITAIAGRSKLLIFRYLASIYVEIIRGTPLLVQILFFFYVVAHAVNIDNRYVVGIVALSLFSGAYIAETIRAGIDGVNVSQWESARAIGFTKGQTYRFVVLPQAFRRILPSLTGQFASLIKDSSLLSIIGIMELTHSAQQVNSATYSTLESFLPLALCYLVITLPLSLASKYLERRLRYET